MASIDFKTGRITDRAKGQASASYHVPKISKSFMKECLKAHCLISIAAGHCLPKEEMRATVLRFAVLDGEGRKEIIKRLALQDSKACPKGLSLESLADSWAEHKAAEGLTSKQAAIVSRNKNVILRFFQSEGLKTTSDLNYETAVKFMAWRSGRNFGIGGNPVSASTVTKEVQVLRQMAKAAFRQGYLPNGNLWDDIKVKAIAGVNKKVVEPLSVERQKELLRGLKSKPHHHDIALLLLITGIRTGELESIRQGSIKNNVLVLHGEGVGSDKPLGGKTASSSRTLPVCSTLLKLFERGNIFKTSRNAFRLALKKRFRDIHPHRLRHTFAVNNLLAQKPLQMVSYRMGHAKTDLTANLYGKFVPEHFKAGFEEAIKERKELLDWLEDGYFG